MISKQKILSTFNSFLYPVSLCLRQIMGTLVIFILARYIPVYEYGLFSSYKAIATFCLLFANAGYNEYILISSKGDVDIARKKISLFLVNAIFIILLIFLSTFFYNVESRFLFFLVLIRTFFDSVFFLLVLPYFQTSKKFNIISYVNLFYGFVLTIFAIILVFTHMSLTNFLILNIGLGLFNFLQVTCCERFNYIEVFKDLKSSFSLIDKNILFYIGALVCSYLYGQIPALYISLFVSKSDAALYFAASSIAAVIVMITVAQNQKVIADLINTSIYKIKLILKRNIFIIISITFSIFIFTLVLGKWILKLIYFQDYYVQAYPILLLLMLSNIFIAEAAVFGAYITASGFQRKKIIMQLEATIIAIFVLLILQSYKIYAAGFATLLSSLYIAIRYTLFVLGFIRKQEQKT